MEIAALLAERGVEKFDIKLEREAAEFIPLDPSPSQT
jgi:hypothetical protein